MSKPPRFPHYPVFISTFHRLPKLSQLSMVRKDIPGLISLINNGYRIRPAVDLVEPFHRNRKVLWYILLDCCAYLNRVIEPQIELNLTYTRQREQVIASLRAVDRLLAREIKRKAEGN